MAESKLAWLAVEHAADCPVPSLWLNTSATHSSEHSCPSWPPRTVDVAALGQHGVLLLEAEQGRLLLHLVVDDGLQLRQGCGG